MGTDDVRQAAVPAQKTELPEFPEEIHMTVVSEGTTRNYHKYLLLTSNAGDEVMENQTIYLGKRMAKAWGAEALEVVIRPIRKR